MQVQDVGNTTEGYTTQNSFIYANWSIENFKDLYKIITGKNMNLVLTNFIQGYVHVMGNFDAYKRELGYENLHFKYYFDNMVKFYESNPGFIDRINPNFSKLLLDQNSTLSTQTLKSAIQVDAEYFHFLGNSEKNDVSLMGAGFKTFIGYITSRYISYYHSDAPVHINLEDAISSWEKLITDCHHSTKCAFSFDYGWSSVSEWLSIIDDGKKEIIVSYAKISPQVKLSDLVSNVLSQKPYARNENALNILRNAAKNYQTMVDRVEAASAFMKCVSATSSFKEVQDNYRKSFPSKK